MISIKSRRSTTHRLLRPGRCQNGSGESRLRRGYHGRSDSESKFSVGSQHQSGAAVAGLPVRSMLSYHADSLGHSKPRNEDLGGQHGRRGRVRDHRALRPLSLMGNGRIWGVKYRRNGDSTSSAPGQSRPAHGARARSRRSPCRMADGYARIAHGSVILITRPTLADVKTVRWAFGHFTSHPDNPSHRSVVERLNTDNRSPW